VLQRIISEYNFLFLGPTGSGKSYIIEKINNSLNEKKIDISGGMFTSVTYHTMGYTVKIGEDHLNLIDTPGFGDTGDRDILNLINTSIRTCLVCMELTVSLLLLMLLVVSPFLFT